MKYKCCPLYLETEKVCSIIFLTARQIKVARIKEWQETSECEQVLFSDGCSQPENVFYPLPPEIFRYGKRLIFDWMERVRDCPLIRKFHVLFLSPPDQFLNSNLFFLVEWKGCAFGAFVLIILNCWFHTRQIRRAMHVRIWQVEWLESRKLA